MTQQQGCQTGTWSDTHAPGRKSALSCIIRTLNYNNKHKEKGRRRGFDLMCFNHNRSRFPAKTKQKFNYKQYKYWLIPITIEKYECVFQTFFYTSDKVVYVLTVVGILTTSFLNSCISFTTVAGKYPMMPIWSTYRSL